MRALALVATVAMAGCGGAAAFNLTSADNDADRLQQALAVRTLPAAPRPTGPGPRVFLVHSGKVRKLSAHDLAQGNALWSVDADVQSRVVVGATFVAALEGSEVVGRDASSGKVRWKHSVPGAFLGLAADAERAIVVHREDGATRPTWWLTAIDGKTGDVIWRADAVGQLGTPAAQGGLVFSPFLSQWMSVLDARTGTPITRVRGVDQQISFVKTTSDGAWFGSAQGVFRIDTRAASGTQAGSTYAALVVPPQLAKAQYAPDGFDAVQAGYTAADRARILWRGSPREEGLELAAHGTAVHYFRYVFGLGPDGGVVWAYSHPRVELVASEHLGPVLGFVSGAGEVVALDAKTGAVRFRSEAKGDGGQVLGATFDADGWSPSSVNEARGGTALALVTIARDRDQRFEKVKALAVSALAALTGPEVTTELLTLLRDPRTQVKLKDTIVEVLVARHDPSGAAALADALSSERHDFVAGEDGDQVGAMARIVAGIDAAALSAEQRSAVLTELIHHLWSPSLRVIDLAAVIRAIAVVGGDRGAAALRGHLLLYRGWAELAEEEEWRKAILGAIAGHGAAIDVAALRRVRDDPTSTPALAAAAGDILR
jgi:outer membrane protein assembly factor BamB